MLKPVEQRKLELKSLEKDLAEWEDLKRHGAWKKLINYLEQRYVNLGQEDCDSVKALAARNKAMSEIKAIFAFIHHDFQYKDALLHEIQTFQQDELEIPDRDIHFG